MENEIDGDAATIGQPIVGERHVDIPDECLRVKADYFEEPSKAVIREIREFVATTGESHMWRGHTHNAPSLDARVKYLDYIELPEKFARKKLWLVCPVCHPSSRWFGKDPGVIAWFPDEGVIRLIGPDCFSKLNKKGHDEALDELVRRKKRERDNSFLLGQREQHLSTLAALKATGRVALALDQFGVALRKTLVEKQNIEIWRHVKSGALEVVERFREAVSNRNNPTNVSFSESERLQPYSHLRGCGILNPAYAKLAPKFAAPVKTLEEIAAIGDWPSFVDGLSETDRDGLVRRLTKATKAAKSLREQVVELRSFLSVLNISTLRTWGSLGNSPVAIWARQEGNVLLIGRTESVKMRVTIPPEMDTEIAEIVDPAPDAA